MSAAAQFQATGIDPTAEQDAIRVATQRRIIVEANAGAAKTTTLALRMAESWRRGVAAEKIFALTYTEPACDALRRALKKIGVPAELIRRFRISTFESFSAGFLRRWDGAAVKQLGSAEALKPYVVEALHRVESNPDERWPDELFFPGSGDTNVEAFLGECLQLKGTMQLEMEAEEGRVTPELADTLGRNYALLKTFLAYERIRAGGNPDHPVFRGPYDATYDLARLISTDQLPGDAVGWPAGIRVLVLDEMHDLNQSMFFVLQRLLVTNPGAFFCGVGDRHQVIHRIAGADPRFMADEIEIATSQPVQRYPLTASYRFGSSVAGLASKLTGKPYSSACAHETEVSVCSYSDDSHCSELIVEAAHQWKLDRGSAQMARFAVLLRHSHQSVVLENMLLDANVPYAMQGFASYLHRPEVLLVRGLLAVATDDFSSVEDLDTRRRILEAFVFFGDIRIDAKDWDPEDQAGMLREAVNAAKENPSRFITTFFENQVVRNAHPEVRRRLLSAVAVARQASGPQMLHDFVKALDLQFLASRVLVERYPLQQVGSNIAGLLQSASSFTGARDFFTSLNDAEVRQRKLKTSNSLLLASIESIKGLEFDQVLMPFLRHQVFPDPLAAHEDERNLFYVGMTRAREALVLYAHADEPSVFLSEMGRAAKPARPNRTP